VTRRTVVLANMILRLTPRPGVVHIAPELRRLQRSLEPIPWPAPGAHVANTTKPGFVSVNSQIVIRDTGLPGTDHLQRIYVLHCALCDHVYGANGSDIHDRKCPMCQGGRPGVGVLASAPATMV